MSSLLFNELMIYTKQFYCFLCEKQLQSFQLYRAADKYIWSGHIIHLHFCALCFKNSIKCVAANLDIPHKIPYNYGVVMHEM